MPGEGNKHKELKRRVLEEHKGSDFISYINEYKFGDFRFDLLIKLKNHKIVVEIGNLNRSNYSILQRLYQASKVADYFLWVPFDYQCHFRYAFDFLHLRHKIRVQGFGDPFKEGDARLVVNLRDIRENLQFLCKLSPRFKDEIK